MSAFHKISVIITACNPGMRHLRIVLEALKNQMLPKDQWELIVIDDASKKELVEEKMLKSEKAEMLKRGEELVREEEERIFLDLSWHPNARLVETDAEREGIGLVSSRLHGFELGSGDVFVFVDQDNALRPDYLQGVVEVAKDFPHLGTWGGQILLKFDEPDKAPDPWLRGALCTRELTHDVWSNVIEHHGSTPWGAGLCARREVLELYRQSVLKNPMRRLLDPTPKQGGFGGDSDLSYVGCRADFGKGVMKRLILDHLIPRERCSDEYLIRRSEADGYSTVLHGFVDHNVLKPPRNDWRFWVMSYIRRSRLRRLEWEIDMARRRGMWVAVREISANVKVLKDYAAKLGGKAGT